MIKNRVTYAFFVIVSLFGCAYYGAAFTYVLFYSLLILPVLSVSSLFLAARRVSVTESANISVAAKNEEAQYQIRVVNNGFFAYSRIRIFLTIMGTPKTFFVPYEKRKKAVLSAYIVSFPYRGKYVFGVEKYCIYDFLCLAKRVITRGAPVSLIVLPSVHSGITLRADNTQTFELDAIGAQTDDLTEISDVRKYTPQDSYKRIHWKLTAKKNEFIVKNYNQTVFNKTYVFLDVSAKAQTDPAEEDFLISAAAGAVMYCLKTGLPVYINYSPFADDFTFVRNTGDFNDLLLILSEVAFSCGDYLAGHLNAFVSSDDYFNIVAVLSEINADLCAVLTYLSAGGHNVFVLLPPCAAPKNSAPDYLEELNLSGVCVTRL